MTTKVASRFSPTKFPHGSDDYKTIRAGRSAEQQGFMLAADGCGLFFSPSSEDGVVYELYKKFYHPDADPKDIIAKGLNAVCR